MKTFRFLDFPVYILAKDFYRLSIIYTKKFPPLYWELKDQWRRAALSISLNIAEGSAKYSNKDFKRFVETALGSANECMACIDIAKSHALLNDLTYRELSVQLDSIARQLGGLSKKLRSSAG